MHKLFFVVIFKQQDFSNRIFPQRCSIFDKKIIRIQDCLLRLKTFKRAMKIENIYRLYRICILRFAFVKQPRPKILAGRKSLNSQTRPIGQDLKYLTPPCVPNLPFKSVYLPLTERKGSRPICFYIPPFFPCTQATKIEKTKYEPHPFHKAPLVK